MLGFYLSSINIATCHLCHFSLCLVLFHLAFSSCQFFFFIFSLLWFSFSLARLLSFFYVVCGTRSVSAYLLVLFPPAASASASRSPSASNLFLIYKFFMRCFDNALTTLPTNESLNNYKAAAAVATAAVAAFFCLFNFALLCNADGGPFPLPLPLLFLSLPPLRPTWGRKCVKCNIIIYALTRFISLAYLPCTLCN